MPRDRGRLLNSEREISTIVVMDLDGTLVKMKIDLAAAKKRAAEIARKFGVEMHEKEPFQDFLDRVFAVLPEERWVELRDNVFAVLREKELEAASEPEVHDGIPEILHKLKERGIRLTVATNSHREAALQVLKSTGLDGYFEKVYTRDDVGKMKPRPDILLKIAEEYRVPASKIVYVGDSVNDFRAASAAGARFIGVSWGFHTADEMKAAGVADIVFKPEELLNHLSAENLKHQRIVPDTSAIINGSLTQLVETGQIDGAELIIPAAAIDELQAQASQKREPGFVGLNELKKIRSLAPQHNITIRIAGERPSLEDIKLARKGRIDALIREVAKRENAVLHTSDYVQSIVAETEGVAVRYFPPTELPPKMSFEQYFTEDTLSLHFKEGAPLMAKRGKPGAFVLVKLSEKPLDAGELNNLIKEIAEYARVRPEGNIEIVRAGTFVAQIGNYRIAVARPPFSDGLEVTVVRPIVKLRIEDYNLPASLLERFEKKAEGILIAGPPGSGKSTFAASLAEFYSRKGKIVKTLESPRDLQVGPEITQYGPLEGDFEKTAEILLLVRPDYTVFDEIRKDRDFQVFSDMRLAGVGMVGVVHSSDAVGAIQRFIGRLELGTIPHVIDTVVFLEAGKISKVYTLSMTVRVPTGMTEAALARPLVEVRDFLSGRLEYEIYTFGEENVIIPVQKILEQVDAETAEIKEKIRNAVRGFDENSEVEAIGRNRFVVRVDRDVIPRVIGRKGENISQLEKELQVSIDVEPRIPSLGKEVKFNISESGNSLRIEVGEELAGKTVGIYASDQFLFAATVGRKGVVSVRKKSEHGKALLKAIYTDQAVKVILTS
ncbi:MAG: HAD-IA family hydrolase [Candidatus Caldarchaeum sp.]|nr:HAD-IA family hydrolase [Candidatus Caldarchaeum sp.]